MYESDKEFYKKVVFQGIYKFLSFIDKGEFSPTRGCADRDFWKYRILRRFSSASFQAPIASLALLYTMEFPQNDFHKNPIVLRLIVDLFKYWVSLQNPDGSFDEWFLRERSFCATSFTAWAMGEGLRCIHKEYTPSGKEREALLWTAAFLSRNRNNIASNQMLASTLALYNLGEVLGDEEILAQAGRRMEQAFALQDEEGWFLEYGGFDMGYSFIHLDCLCDLYKICQSPEVRKRIQKLVHFLYHVVGPCGVVAGELSSREAAHIMPYGLEYTCGFLPQALSIKKAVFDGYQKGVLLYPSLVDDRYAFYFYINSFTKALIETTRDKPAKAPGADREAQGPLIPLRRNAYFKNAGLLIRETDERFCLVSTARGGAIRVFQGEQTYVDQGYLLKIGGYIYTNGVMQHFDYGERTLRITTQLYRIPRLPHMPLFLEALAKRLMALPLAAFLSKRIFFKMNLHHKRIPLYLEREISFGDKEILIRDTLNASGGKIAKNIRGFCERKFQGGLVSMSSDFFTSGWLNPYSISGAEEKDIISRIKKGGRVEVVKKIQFGEKITTEVTVESLGPGSSQ